MWRNQNVEPAQELNNLPAIQFTSGPLAWNVLPIRKTSIELGRDDQNDIAILDSTVSRHHARIRFSESRSTWIIECISLTSMITVDQQPIQRGILQHESVVVLGRDCSFIFLLPPPLQKLSSTELAAPLPASSELHPSHNTPDDVSLLSTIIVRNVPSLIISSNIHSNQQVYALKKGIQAFTIGRDPSSDIVIDERVVSSLHAQIIRESGNLVLIHPHPTREKTTNGLLYQGRHIHGNEHFRKILVSGDVFSIGHEHGTLITLTYNEGTHIS